MRGAFKTHHPDTSPEGITRYRGTGFVFHSATLRSQGYELKITFYWLQGGNFLPRGVSEFGDRHYSSPNFKSDLCPVTWSAEPTSKLRVVNFSSTASLTKETGGRCSFKAGIKHKNKCSGIICYLKWHYHL